MASEEGSTNAESVPAPVENVGENEDNAVVTPTRPPHVLDGRYSADHTGYIPHTNPMKTFQLRVMLM